MNGVVNKSNRQVWIDCTRAVAMLAVIVDHCSGILYTNQAISKVSVFSVSLFVLLSGTVAGLHTGSDCINIKRQMQRVFSILKEYAVATFIIMIAYDRFFDLRTYIYHLINFDIQGPMYYIVFFCQLLLFCPLLFSVYEFCEGLRWKWIGHMIALLGMIFVSAICIHYTYILPVYGGGQYVGGGTYLLLYYVGIVLGKKGVFERLLSIKKCVLGITVIVWPLVCYGWVTDKLPFDRYLNSCFGEGINPPGANLMIYALMTLFFLFAIFSVFIEAGYFKRWVAFGSWIGKNTLYIFLYHVLMRDIARKAMGLIKLNSNSWIGRCFIISSMLILPVIGVKVHQYFKNQYEKYMIKTIVNNQIDDVK